MTELAFPPGLLLIIGAVLIPFLKGPLRSLYLLAVPLAALYLVLNLPDGAGPTIDFLGMTLQPMVADKLSRFFGVIFTLMGFAGLLFALNQRKVQELVAIFVYSGASLGVVFAGDLVTVFLYWEIMAVAAGIIILSGGFKTSFGSGMRYFMIHFLGGVLLMAGIAAHYSATGSIEFSVLGPPDSVGTWLILAGFLINAGAPPFSAWVGDAYPEASFSGAVILSAYTTKTAVYVLLRGFPGTEILVPIGVFMVFYGIIMALLENDARRILAQSTVNQVGFMVTGVGIGTPLALNGAAAHAFAHVLFKGLLLMSAGAVLVQTGKRKCSDMGGLFQSMPVTAICGTIGAFAISAFPLTSGFVTKSMINDAAAYEHMTLVWFLLVAASAGVFLHAGIKFPWFVFFQKDSGMRPPDPPWNMQAAMIFVAALCIGIGSFPGPFYALLPHEVKFIPYTAPHVINMLQLLAFSGLSFFLLLPLMKRTLTITLDFDWVYRRLGQWIALASVRVWDVVDDAAGRAARGLAQSGVGAVMALSGEQGAFGSTARTGGTVFLVTLGLGGALLLTFFVTASEISAVPARDVPDACRTMPEVHGLATAKDRAAVFLVQGRCAFDSRRPDAALAAYDLAVQERPEWYRVYELRAEAYEALGLLDEAAADKEKAQELKRNPPAEEGDDGPDSQGADGHGADDHGSDDHGSDGH